MKSSDQKPKPEILFVASIHGNEGVGKELLMEFLEHLCKNKDDYKTSEVRTLYMEYMLLSLLRIEVL